MIDDPEALAKAEAEVMDRVHDDPEKTAGGIAFLLLACILALSVLSGCSVFRDKYVGPGVDGVKGTADDVFEDSDATETARGLADLASILGFGALAAPVVMVVEGISGLVTAAKPEEDEGAAA